MFSFALRISDGWSGILTSFMRHCLPARPHCSAKAPSTIRTPRLSGNSWRSIARQSKAGKALPGVIAEVVDSHGNKMPPNKGGLLVLRKPFPHLFRTVYGDPERYAHDWGKIPNAYTTGDVAVCDEDGYFIVVGRG